MIVGIVVIFSALPGIPYLASVVSVGPITVTEVSEVNATRLIIGVIMFVLGLAAYLGEKGLKIFTGKK